MENQVLKQLGIEVPVFCGAMYPCSNPELVAAVSASGAMGLVQPLSMIYVWGHDFREGLRSIRKATDKPFGMNAILERHSKMYEDRMMAWIQIALEEGCRFFVTALGNPAPVVKLAKAAGAIVYHDVTEKKWAMKALDAGVDGLICVNNRAGGHAGTRSPEALYAELSGLGVPLVCAGGVGDEETFTRMLQIGYSAVQMGTRFIATEECRSHKDYKDAILKAEEDDIVLTERVTGIPLAVIKTPYVEEIGTKAGPIARWLLQHRKTKQWMRLYYNLNAIRRMKRSAHKGLSTKDYWQAGKSVAGIERIEKAGDIVARFRKAYQTFTKR